MSEMTIVVPTLERLDLVKAWTKSFKATCPKPWADVAVVAQGQDDGTIGYCRHQGFEVVKHPEALSFAKANNHAAAKVTSPWLMLCNNDVEFQPGFWEAMVGMVGLGYEIIGAKMLYPDSHPSHPGKIQHFGKFFTLDFYPFHVLRYQPADHPEAMRPRAFPDVSFACVIIRMDVWHGMEGLDEQFNNGFEDDDFCLRARDSGAQIGIHHLALVHHMESQTTGHDNDNKEAQWVKFKQKWVDSGKIQWPLGIWQGWRNP